MHRGGGFARAVFEADAVLNQDVLRVGKNVHQVRDRRALVTRNIRDSGFEQRLGDGEDALAAKHFALPQAQLLDFFGE